MRKWLTAFVFDWLVVISFISLFSFYTNLLTGLLAVLLIGTRQHALAVLGHDGSHKTITKTKWLNDLLAKICFLPFGINLNKYRAFHLTHHRFLGTSLDPELSLKAQNQKVWQLPVSFSRILFLSLKDFLIWPALRDILPFIKMVASVSSVLIASIIWLSVLIIFGWQPIVLWFLALCTSFWASNRLRIWQEHTGTSGVHCVKATWWQRFLFLPHNIGYHLEHHETPGVPFYQLPSHRINLSIPVGTLFRGFA